MAESVHVELGKASKGRELRLVNPSRRYRGRDLSTIGGIRGEMANVYRQCRRGSLDVTEGAKLCYMLRLLVEIESAHLFDQRLRTLESTNADARG